MSLGQDRPAGLRSGLHSWAISGKEEETKNSGRNPLGGGARRGGPDEASFVAGLMAIAMLVSVGQALAEPIELGPCNDPNSIKARVGQTAKVCVKP